MAGPVFAVEPRGFHALFEPPPRGRGLEFRLDDSRDPMADVIGVFGGGLPFALLMLGEEARRLEDVGTAGGHHALRMTVFRDTFQETLQQYFATAVLHRDNCQRPHIAVGKAEIAGLVRHPLFEHPDIDSANNKQFQPAKGRRMVADHDPPPPEPSRL